VLGRAVFYTGLILCFILIFWKVIVPTELDITPATTGFYEAGRMDVPIPANVKHSLSFNYRGRPVTFEVGNGVVKFMGETQPATAKAQIKKILDDTGGDYEEYSMKLYKNGSFLIQCNTVDIDQKKRNIVQVVGGLIYAGTRCTHYYLDEQTRAGRLIGWVDDEPKESEDTYKITMSTLWYQLEYIHPNGATLYVTTDLVSTFEPGVKSDREVSIFFERNIPKVMKDVIDTLTVRELTKT